MNPIRSQRDPLSAILAADEGIFSFNLHSVIPAKAGMTRMAGHVPMQQVPTRAASL